MNGPKYSLLSIKESLTFTQCRLFYIVTLLFFAFSFRLSDCLMHPKRRLEKTGSKSCMMTSLICLISFLFQQPVGGQQSVLANSVLANSILIESRAYYRFTTSDTAEYMGSSENVLIERHSLSSQPVEGSGPNELEASELEASESVLPYFQHVTKIRPTIEIGAIEIKPTEGARHTVPSVGFAQLAPIFNRGADHRYDRFPKLEPD